jgi:hypothetical protein
MGISSKFIRIKFLRMLHKSQIYIALALLIVLFTWEPVRAGEDDIAVIRLTQKINRTWISPEIWANPLQDWQLSQGRMECVGSGGERNLFLLTHQLSDQAGSFSIRVKAGRLHGDHQTLGEGWIGFSLGVKGNLSDYRDDAVRGTGYPIGITTEGKMFIGRHISDQVVIDPGKNRFVILAEGKPDGDKYIVTLTVMGSKGNYLGRMDSEVEPERLTGGVALVCHSSEKKGNVCFWFSDWRVGGEKFIAHEERAWGPVLFCHYNLSGQTLKLKAQLAPVGDQDDQKARLEVERQGVWQIVSEAPVDSLSRSVTFRIDNWQESKDITYRVRYACFSTEKRKTTHFYTGTVRHEPWEKEEFVIAALSESHTDGFPYADVVKSVTWHDPDLLFFSDGQVNPDSYTESNQSKLTDMSVMDCLTARYLFGWAYGDLLRSRPTVAITDDQVLSEIHGLDDEDREIRYAGVSFAVIEDQKFRSDPESLLAKARIVRGRATNPEFNPGLDSDLPEAVLLGEMQEQFLEQWSHNWSNGIWMKVVLSQNLFNNLATRPVEGSHDVPDQDFNSNGWPQTSRNRALEIMRKGFAFHLTGSQGLGGVVQYGMVNWRDAGYAFSVPPVSNLSPGRWCPREPGYARFELDPRYTGDYLDGFGNKMTVYAVANPSVTGLESALQNGQAEGYGIVRLNRNTRDITLECWPRQADPANPDSRQYPGWPLVINQLRNRAQYAQWELPLIKVPDMKNSVIQVVSESTGMVQYAIRINGHAFRPPVDKPGKYTLFVGEPGSDHWQGIPGFEAAPSYMTREYVVRF